MASTGAYARGDYGRGDGDASTGAYVRGDYGRGDGDASSAPFSDVSMNHAPPTAQAMTTDPSVVDAAVPSAPTPMYGEFLLADHRKREVYATGKDGEKVLVRLNMAIEGGQGSFGPNQMLRGKDRTTVPRALEDVGMSWEEYHDVFVTQLDAIGNEHVGCAPTCLCPFLCPLCPFLCPFIRKSSGEAYLVMEQRINSFDADLREWQTNANAMFEKYHVYLKTQSYSYMKHDDHGELGRMTTRIYQRWIVVALNDEDAARLSAEPHLSGIVNPNEPACQGCNCPRFKVDETAGFCMHPYPQIRSDYTCMNTHCDTC